MKQLKKIKNKIEFYKNTLVLDERGRMAMLIDFFDDDDDYYWVLDYGSMIEYHSCLLGLIYLKDVIDNDQYNRLITSWNFSKTKPINIMTKYDQSKIINEIKSRFSKKFLSSKMNLEIAINQVCKRYNFTLTDFFNKNNKKLKKFLKSLNY